MHKILFFIAWIAPTVVFCQINRQQLVLQKNRALESQLKEMRCKNSNLFQREVGDIESLNTFSFLVEKEDTLLRDILTIDSIIKLKEMPQKIEENRIYIKGIQAEYIENKYSIFNFQKDSLEFLENKIKNDYFNNCIQKIDSIKPKIISIYYRYNRVCKNY